jgi:hypothetical protein
VLETSVGALPSCAYGGKTAGVTGERWLRSTERPCARSQSTNSGISKHQPNIRPFGAPGKNNFTAHAESESVQY